MSSIQPGHKSPTEGATLPALIETHWREWSAGHRVQSNKEPLVTPVENRPGTNPTVNGQNEWRVELDVLGRPASMRAKSPKVDCHVWLETSLLSKPLGWLCWRRKTECWAGSRVFYTLKCSMRLAYVCWEIEIFNVMESCSLLSRAEHSGPLNITVPVDTH